MDPFSGITSGFAVCGQLEACIQSLRQLYNTLKFAKRDVRQLMQEVYICQGLFSIFNDITRPLGSTVMELAQEKNLDEALQTQATSALDQINHVMTKFKPLMKGSSPSSFDELLAKVRWHFTKQEIQALMITFSTVKCSLNLLSCLLTLESSLAKFAQQSTANKDHDSLLSQITTLKKTVHRQSKSLKKLAKTMNDTFQAVHESPLINNTETMIAIIKKIQKVPVDEARALIAREGRKNPSRVMTPTPTARDPISRQSSGNIGLGNTRSRSSSRVPSVIASPHSQETPYQAAVTVSRERRRTREYGDGSREHHDGESSSSSIRNGRHKHMLFVPNPPFTQADLDERNRNRSEYGKNL
ncbi:hypothetical protein N7520_009092 [Penicillium odoratum]|uniref:uncharacterized protein n=1 Tax=Penicillium odoratum TaxID=1167516 RepID=UPI0025484BAE|nr:uncharacterized protein N7520_009092 [Penicillium odoratum]KAJ5752175.1 hypothetical protein N7520_009092 [Penicillium odoratum]